MGVGRFVRMAFSRRRGLGRDGHWKRAYIWCLERLIMASMLRIWVDEDSKDGSQRCFSIVFS
jgi:hypothetical protein